MVSEPNSSLGHGYIESLFHMYEAKTMDRIINGILLPTFLPTSPTKFYSHLSYSIKDEYKREIYAWQYFEEGCEEWYMDDANFWDDNYFQLIFDESTPPYVEESEEKVIHISFQLTPFPLDVWVLDPHLTFSSYGDALLDIHDSIYVDPHDQVLEHRTQLSITLKAH